MVAKEKGSGGEIDWEFGISRCKLLYIEWINSKVLLYSTGNYIQYSVINHNRKQTKKKKLPVSGSVTLNIISMLTILFFFPLKPLPSPSSCIQCLFSLITFKHVIIFKAIPCTGLKMCQIFVHLNLYSLKQIPLHLQLSNDETKAQRVNNLLKIKFLVSQK